MESLSASLQAGLHTSLNVSETVKGDFSASQNLPALQGTTITVLVGDVPIGVTPSLTPFVGANGSAEATVSTGVTTDTSLTLAQSYANGTWSPVNSALSPTTAAVTTSAGANTSLKAFAGLRAGLAISTPLLPNVGATVSLSGDGYLQLTAGLNDNPCWTLDAGLEASAGIAATVFDKTVADLTTQPLSIYSANIAQASGPCYTVTVVPEKSSLDIGATVQQTATETDLLGNPVSAQFEWSSSNANVATVDQNGLVTAVASGVAQINATDTTTTAVGVATVNVGVVPPTYFLVGNWVGTANVTSTDGTSDTFNVGASVSQTLTTFAGTITVLAAGDVPITYTLNGQINGSSVTFTTTSTDSTTDIGDGTAAISPDGLQVNGTGVDGSSGVMTWDGKNTLSGSGLIVGDPLGLGILNATWTGTITINGLTLTGTSTDSNGDTMTWNLSLQ